MNNEKIIAWAVMKDGDCLSVRRFEPVASGEAEGVEFVPLVRFAEQPAQQHVLEVRVWRDKNHDQHAEFRGYDKLPDGEHVFYTSPQPAQPSKPLTDEQIMEMFNKVSGVVWISDFARAIEAAHGIKGDA